MDDATWGALAFVLTVLGGGYTWWAFRNRGVAAGTTGAALTLLPAAAYLTGTLKMFTEIGSAIGGWATDFVFSPSSWLGIILAGVSVVLFGTARVIRNRSGGTKPAESAAPPSGQLPPARRPEPAIDDDLAEIEAILKKRGIS